MSDVIEIRFVSDDDQCGKADEQKRLDCIKLKRPLIRKKCKLCGCSTKKMWYVKRWSYTLGNTTDTYYCTNCMKDKKSVLYEVDTDESAMGIANCDSPICITKLDKSRMVKFNESRFG